MYTYMNIDMTTKFTDKCSCQLNKNIIEAVTIRNQENNDTILKRHEPIT